MIYICMYMCVYIYIYFSIQTRCFAHTACVLIYYSLAVTIRR